MEPNPRTDLFWSQLMKLAARSVDYQSPVPDLSEEFLSVWSRHYAIIANMTIPEGRTLEIGTGFGILAAGLGKITGKPVWSTEHPSRSYIYSPSYRHFLESHGVHLVANDLRDGLPFRSGVANHIYLCDVIEHLDMMDARKLIEEIHRVLPSGGMLIISTPNVNRLSNIFRLIGGYSIQPPPCRDSYGKTHGHVHEYAIRELRQELHENGFIPIRSVYGLNPFYTREAFGGQASFSQQNVSRINRCTALIHRLFPRFSDQIYVLAKRD